MRSIVTLLAISLTIATSYAITPKRYGTGQGAKGFEKPINTVFTSPGDDCSTSMIVSWASDTAATNVLLKYGPAEKDCEAPAIHIAKDTKTLCTTFDSIPSKLGDNSDVVERHVFYKHKAILTDLKPNTRYEYTIQAFREDGSYNTSPHYFTTAGADRWTAAVIGDFHHYSPLWRRLDAATAMLNTLDSVAGGIDWVLSPGDQCAWGASYNYWSELAEQPMYKNFMWASVQGNHDHMSSDRVLTDAYFRDTHAFPDNGYPGQEGVCYSFTYGDALFIMLNNEAMRNDSTLNIARRWIEETAAASDARYKIVVEHYEWLSGIDGHDSQLPRFADLFSRLGIDLALSGNNHIYLRTHPIGGTHYVVNPSSDNSRGRDIKPLVANDDIIATRWSEGPHTVGAMLMHHTPEALTLTLYDRYGIAHDTVTVPARK